MKHPQIHRHAGPRLEPVRFEFTHPTASRVCVAGTFNDWHADTKPLRCLGEGHWLKETVLAPGTYEYCLVVDGVWMADPCALESVSNPFGGRNSLLTITEDTELHTSPPVENAAATPVR